MIGAPPLTDSRIRVSYEQATRWANGLPVTADGALAVSTSALTRHGQGKPLSTDALAVAEAAVSRYGQGLPLTSTGALAVDYSNAVVRWHNGLPLTASGAIACYSPVLSLFLAGEQGAWYDPSDFSTMYQDSAGTTPVTAVGQPVGRILDKSGRGNHATQATAASRPTLRQDASGYYYLEFDGVDDSLATASVDFSATDKMTVWAGVQRAADTSQCIVEHGTGASAATTSFNLFVPGAARFQAALYDGALASTANGALAAAPQTAVLTMQGDFAAASAATQLVLRSKGAASATGGTLLAAANFGNRVLNLGRRNAASAPLNGRLYSLIVRGAASSASQITQAERYVASKMGVTL